MGYYILVEKDSKLMHKCWKWIIIGVLVLIITTCFATSYAFQSLVQNFNSNCVSGASIAYKPITFKPIGTKDNNENNSKYADQNYANKIKEYFEEFKSYHVGPMAKADTEIAEVPKTQIYQLLNKDRPLFSTTTERTNVTNVKGLLHRDDANFFNNYEIDETATEWGHLETCSYFYYYPVIETIVAIVWIVFIVISGHPGERMTKTFIHKSWRLVLPATICFGVLTILGAIYGGILNSRLNAFCTEFKQKFNNTEIPCKLLINRFSLNDDTALLPSTNFNLSKILPWLTMVLWLLAAFIMLLRCILGADFEIEEIEQYAESSGTALDPEQDTNPNSKVKFNENVRRYSRERIYKPTTQPANASASQ